MAVTFHRLRDLLFKLKQQWAELWFWRCPWCMGKGYVTKEPPPGIHHCPTCNRPTWAPRQGRMPGENQGP